MPRLTTSLLTLALLACGSPGGEPKPPSCDGNSPLPPLVGPMPPAGSVFGSVEGAFSTALRGRASGYQQGSATAAYTILDGYNTDARNRPTGELFVLLRSAAKVGGVPLVPVTLEQLNNPGFFPTGAIAAYAEAYDATAKEYTRWLLAKSGCVRVASVSGGADGEVHAFAILKGEWRSNTGALLGQGTASALIDAPLLDFRAGTAPDSMRASITGIRAKPFVAATLDAFQVLHPQQTRLVVVGTQPADTTREIWLTINGVPQTGDSIALGAVTLAEARATRADPPRSFAMLRLLEFAGTKPAVREIWISSSGWVKFGKVVQNGPLALCGAVSGTFAFTAEGTSLSNPSISLGTSSVSAGSFGTRMTIVAQSDTLVDPASLPLAARSDFVAAAPVSTMGFGCP